MKPESIKALGTITARNALKRLGSDATIEALEIEVLELLKEHDLSATDLRTALDWAVRDVHRFHRSI